MRLPAPLLHRNPTAHKNSFGHVLIVAGSPRMLGAAALTSLAAMRAGAGLTTLAIPQSLNATAQKKISPVIMTYPLPETAAQTVSTTALRKLFKNPTGYQAAAIGPGMSRNPNTQRFIRQFIKSSPWPLVIDADALNALAGHTEILTNTSVPVILTPHLGEMARLVNKSPDEIQKKHHAIAKEFAKRYRCHLILKGHRTLIAAPSGKIFVNTTGNAGMATAGSGDVLTGILAAFLAQGLEPLPAARAAVYLHGKAGDLAAKDKTQLSLIATDLIDYLPQSIKNSR